jgi:hypothetical protein
LRVIRPQGPFGDVERVLQQLFGLRTLAGSIVDDAQAALGARRRRMIGAEDFFENGYGLLELRLRLSVVALIEVDPSEIASDERDRQIVGSVQVLGQCARPLEQRTRFRSLAAIAQSRRLRAQARDFIFRSIVGGCRSRLDQADRIFAGCGVRYGGGYSQGVGAGGVGDNLKALIARRSDLVLHHGNGIAGRIGQLEADVDAALLHDHGGVLCGLERDAIRVSAVRGNLSFKGLAAFERCDVFAPGKQRRRQRERDGEDSRHGKPPR